MLSRCLKQLLCAAFSDISKAVDGNSMVNQGSICLTEVGALKHTALYLKSDALGKGTWFDVAVLSNFLLIL